MAKHMNIDMNPSAGEPLRLPEVEWQDTPYWSPIGTRDFAADPPQSSSGSGEALDSMPRGEPVRDFPQAIDEQKEFSWQQSPRTAGTPGFRGWEPDFVPEQAAPSVGGFPVLDLTPLILPVSNPKRGRK